MPKHSLTFSELFFDNIYPFLVFNSDSIPLWDKTKFIGNTTRKLVMHSIDIARDVILIVTLKRIIQGAAIVFVWVGV